MKHLYILSQISMGLRPLAPDSHGNRTRGNKRTAAGIFLIHHKDGSLEHGITLLYPDTGHHYSCTDKTRFDPEKLYRAMRAASKIFVVSTDMVELALQIADPKVALPESWPDGRIARGRFSCDYPSPTSLREAIFEEELPRRELRDLRKEFKRRAFWVHRVGDKVVHMLRKATKR